jgi:hypothetical protein
MRRQKSVQLGDKFAGRNEVAMRPEIQPISRQRFGTWESLLRFAPAAVVALGGSGATHRMHQNDMPPLAGIPGDTTEICCT